MVINKGIIPLIRQNKQQQTSKQQTVYTKVNFEILYSLQIHVRSGTTVNPIVGKRFVNITISKHISISKETSQNIFPNLIPNKFVTID